MRWTVHALRRRLGQAIGAWVLIASLAGHAAAQPCVGDCSGEGRVTIADLILAVNIALGRASLEQCPALGQAPIGVDRLILAVNNALCGCGSCPTPLPTRTFTATPPPTATIPTPTPSPTPTPAPIVSTWEEDNLKLASSSCPKSLNDQIRQAFVNSTYAVTQQGGEIRIEDQNGVVAPGEIDVAGNVRIELIDSASQGACVVTVDQLFTVNLSASPAAAKYVFTVASAHCPNTVNCKLQVTSRWTRTSAAPLRGPSVRAVIHAALHATL